MSIIYLHAKNLGFISKIELGKLILRFFFILIFAKYTILHFLFQMVVDGCHFRIVFPGYGYGYGYVKQLELITGEFIPIVKNAIEWKYCALTRILRAKNAHFYAYLHFLFQMAVYGCHFRIVFPGEFIPIVKNAIECKNCALTRILRAKNAHFYAYLCFLFQMAVDGCHFRKVFPEEFIPIVKNAIEWKYCALTRILRAKNAHFYEYLHFLFQMADDGCHFRIVFPAEFIPIVKNAIKCKNCAISRKKMRISMHTYTFYSRWLLMAVDVSFSIVFPGELISDFTFAHFSFSRNFDLVKFISPTCFVSQLIAFLYGLIYPLTRFMPKIMKFCRKLRGTGVMAFFISKIELGLLILLSVILVFQYSFFFKNLFLIIASMYRLICPFSEQSHFHYLPAWQKSFNLSQKLSWDYWNYF